MKATLRNRFMIGFLCSVLAICLGNNPVYSQLFDSFTVPANSGTVVTSKVLKKGTSYTITVKGAVSIWATCDASNTTCGIDPLYVFHVPNIEIDSNRWPASTYVIDTVEYEGMKLPKWVGTSRDFPDSAVSSLNPFIKVNLLQDIGFRINGNPLAVQNYNGTHSYSFKKVGNDEAIKCNFLDSSFLFLPPVSPRVGRYEDNSGAFIVEIQEDKVDSISVSFCSEPELELNPNGTIKGLRISASVLKVSNQGNQNIPLLHKEIALFENGKFICPDSTACEKKSDSAAVVMLIDRSESMKGPISFTDQQQKMNAAKTAATNFVNKMTAIDKVALMSFGDDVTLDASWTTDTTKINKAIGTLDKRYGEKTPLYKAIDSALEYSKKQSIKRKAIVCLTDGINNMPPDSVQTLLQKINGLNGSIPIYIIALGLDKTDPIVVRALDTLDIIANQSGGRKYESYDVSSLNQIYSFINARIQEQTCCTIYYKVEPCVEGKGDTEREVVIYYNDNGNISFAKTKYKTKCSTLYKTNKTINDELMKKTTVKKIR